MMTTPLTLPSESLMGAAICSTDLAVPSLAMSTTSSSETMISPSPTTLAIGRSSVLREVSWTVRNMQTPSGETCGDRIQENHEPGGIGRDHSVSDAGQGDLKPFSLRLLGLECLTQLGIPAHGPSTGCSQGSAEQGDDQPDEEESESDLGLGLEDNRASMRNQE